MRRTLWDDSSRWTLSFPIFFWCQVSLECEGVGGVQGALTLFCGGVAQAFHDGRVVKLRVQLGVEEVDGEGQEGTGRSRKGEAKEVRPWK